MKKLPSFLLIVITFIAIASLCTACYSPFSGGLMFDDAQEGYEVIGVSGWDRFYKNFSVSIPSEYNGQPVTEIGTGAFLGYASLVSVEIPNSIKIINAGAFEGCVLLPKVDIPDSVTYIGESAFGGCVLLQEIDLPDSVTYIGANAFRACFDLKNVSIPNSVTYIGEDAFTESDAIVYNAYKGGLYLGNENNPYLALIKIKDANAADLTIHSGTKVMQKGLLEGCPSLASITFEGSVPAYYDERGNVTYPYSEIPNLTEVTVKAGSIPERAFYGCAKLTNANITDSVESIGSDAFSRCENLASVTISGSVTGIGDHAFEGCHIEDVYYTGTIGDWCNIRFGIDNANPLYCGANMHLGGELLTALIVPDTVTNIPEFAFANCQSIKTVVISDSVTDIGIYAFAYCRLLESVDLPDTLTTIGNSAFYDCRALGSIEIPDTVTSIGIGAFSGCETLTSIVIPNSVTSIPNEAFSYCDSLASVTFGNAVTSIGSEAFRDCYSLQDIEISDSVISVGKDAFKNVPIATNVYDNGIYLGSVNNPYQILLEAKDTEIKTCEIHSDTRVIAGGAFEGCKALKSIVLPDGIVSIGDFAFLNCEELESVHIPSSVTKIDRRAFENCKALNSIVLSTTITDMGAEVFYKCKSLTVYCEASQQSIANKNWDPYWDYDHIPVVWGYTGE